MAELIVNTSGAQSYKLELSLHDASDSDSVEVWLGIFTEVEHGDSTVVYFEVNTVDSPEIWDLINLAIEAYKLEID